MKMQNMNSERERGLVCTMKRWGGGGCMPSWSEKGESPIRELECTVRGRFMYREF